ncbi:hypothetical protein H7827_09780 [Streptomyces sp. JH002]|jgi:Flp pilus assembly pilin Flp|uniref:hypothetical protein n=1 Tax=Streptomyces TaxID=1883 RepID=UPI001F48B25B|nr:hypothetical protein [Streptomyces sp. NRRL F-2890]
MSRMLLNWRMKVVTHLTTPRHSDRGAGFVEYAGLLLLIAAIVGTVFGLGLDTQISNAVQRAVNNVLGN